MSGDQPADAYRFYKKVKPFGPAGRIRVAAGVTEDEARATHENIPLALAGWVSGCTLVWSALFTIGNILYDRMTYAFILLGVAILSGSVLVAVVDRDLEQQKRRSSVWWA